MKALVIAPQPFFSPRGTPFSVYYRTLVTAELGVDVDLLTYGEGQDVDIPGVRIFRIPRIRCLEPVPIGPSLAKLLLDGLVVIWSVALLLRYRYVFVHAHEEAVFFCRFLKPLFRFKLVYDMHSSLPQQLSNFAFTNSRFLIGVFDRLERSCLKSADAVITICPELAKYAVPLMTDSRRHVLIENSIFSDVRLRNDDRRSTSHPSQPESQTGHPLVVYAGTFEKYQGLEMLVRAFADVRHDLPDAKLVIAGGTTDQVNELRHLADQVGLGDSCVLYGRLHQAQVKRLIDQASIVVSPRITGTNTPLKIYELLSNGVPLVATRICSHLQILDEDVCCLVEPNPVSMANGIVTLWKDPRLRIRLSESAKRLYKEKYSRIAYEGKMRKLIGTLLGEEALKRGREKESSREESIQDETTFEPDSFCKSKVDSEN